MTIQLPSQAHAYIDAQWDAHLERTRTFLCQPSISAQNMGVREAADLFRGWLEQRNAHVEYHGRETHPIIYAEWDAGKPKTLLVYGMYDVQPVDNQAWTTPPFDAKIWNHPRGGESIVARGACNSKGPLMAFLHAVEALRASGDLPVNIKWVIEGEEELGSPGLPEFYDTHRARLQADAAFEPFWTQRELTDPPFMILGTKGIMGLEFICRASEWGGPTKAIHSSIAPWVANPAWRLVQALNTLVDEYQEIAVAGIPPLGQMREDDEQLLRQIAETFDKKTKLADLATARFKRDASPYELLQRLQFSPSLNISGLQSGYIGEEDHTIIPTEAWARCALRLPPGLHIPETLQAIRAHLARHNFGDIEVVMKSGYPSARTSLSAPVAQALIATYQAHGFEPTLWPVESSATPYYLYTDVLRLEFACGGLGAAGGSHGPDEWCSVAGLQALEKSLTTFLTVFAGGE